MDITEAAWEHPDPGRSHVRLVKIVDRVVHALARGDGAAEHPLTAYVRGDDCRDLWRMRSAQIARAPGDAPWVTRFVVTGAAAPVGLAGFHGPPDRTGMVEVGYRIDPQRRRRGHARDALEILLAVAHTHPEVRVVRASISPDNYASLSLVAGYGFVEVGEQIDDDDGLEFILERTVSAPDQPARER